MECKKKKNDFVEPNFWPKWYVSCWNYQCENWCLHLFLLSVKNKIIYVWSVELSLGVQFSLRSFPRSHGSGSSLVRDRLPGLFGCRGKREIFFGQNTPNIFGFLCEFRISIAQETRTETPKLALCLLRTMISLFLAEEFALVAFSWRSVRGHPWDLTVCWQWMNLWQQWYMGQHIRWQRGGPCLGWKKPKVLFIYATARENENKDASYTSAAAVHPGVYTGGSRFIRIRIIRISGQSEVIWKLH